MYKAVNTEPTNHVLEGNEGQRWGKAGGARGTDAGPLLRAHPCFPWQPASLAHWSTLSGHHASSVAVASLPGGAASLRNTWALWGVTLPGGMAGAAGVAVAGRDRLGCRCIRHDVLPKICSYGPDSSLETSLLPGDGLNQQQFAAAATPRKRLGGRRRRTWLCCRTLLENSRVTPRTGICASSEPALHGAKHRTCRSAIGRGAAERAEGPSEAEGSKHRGLAN